ncbi:ASCH domain-containing protein [Actinoalloteichus spitiensis]|uniref:ASCH domain-containing protein n=1 Tax=Actinoalloteichus spitiensis TaxID=252394 RepID=UPI00058473A7|nr:ASCH domain-containing protein [Actinoalloteichus spitiensis]
MPSSGLPVVEFAFPGPLRDRLVAAVLSGAKTSTSSLLIEYESEGVALPVPGARSVVVDSGGRPVAVIETGEVRVVRLDEVDLSHARAEGEGYDSVSAWRAGHEEFWCGADFRAAVGDPTFTPSDGSPVVLERFRVVEVYSVADETSR